MPKTVTITRIATQKRAGRYNVDCDGRFAFGVTETTLIQYGLAKGRELSAELIAEIKASDERVRAIQIGIDYIAQAVRSVSQVRQRLTRKEVPAAIHDDVLTYLQANGYLDDADYAQRYVATKKIIAPKGPLAIARDLYQAGISEVLITQALADYSDDEQCAVAHKLIQNRATHVRTSYQQHCQKLCQHLQQKGFSYAVAQAAVDRLDLARDDDTEHDQAQHSAERLWRRYARRYPVAECQFRVKQQLYRQGFASEVITAALAHVTDES